MSVYVDTYYLVDNVDINNVKQVDIFSEYLSVADLSVALTNTQAPISVDPAKPAEAEIPLLPGMHTDYYNKTYMVPTTVAVNNPQVGSAQRYSIWNARNTANTLNTIREVGGSGWVNSAAALDTLNPMQMRDYTLTLQPGAPVQVNATYMFDLVYGDAQLLFSSSLAVILSQIPEIPITETLSWNTDVIKATDGSEQRISLLTAPKRRLKFDYVIADDVNILRMREELYTNIKSSVIFPLWFEPFDFDGPIVAGTDTLTGDFSLRNFAVDDYLLLYDPETDVSESAQVSSVNDTTLVLKNVTNNAYSDGSIFVPSVICNVPDNSGVSRYPVNAAKVNLEGQDTAFNNLLGTGATAISFNSTTVLDRRPLNNELVPESIGLDLKILDYGIKRQINSFIDNPYLTRQLKFNIATREDLQYWKLFLDTVKGQQKSFYSATYRPDLFVVDQPIQGGSSFSVNDREKYSELFHDNTSLRALAITTADGNRNFHLVDSVTNDSANNIDTISVSPAFDNSVNGSIITKIEYLMLSRLASDTVTFTHFGTYSEIELSTRTI